MTFIAFREEPLRFGVRRVIERCLPTSLLDKVNLVELAVMHVLRIGVLAILVGSIKFVFPEAIPFSMFEFWAWDSLTLDVLYRAWPLFAWGVGFTTLMAVLTSNERHENFFAERYLSKGLGLSLCAGVFEEITFRWLLFFLAIPLVVLIDTLTLGLWRHGYEYLFAPVANFFTLGKLDHILYNGYGWAIGSAVIFSNSRFRDAHAYQGLLGLVNSWFCGMFFFLIMFNHGLPMAILVHFLYDVFIFVVRYVDSVIERYLGWY